jgi:sirohydrochlorin ferrochelatase
MAQHPENERTAVLLIAHGSRHAPANDDLHQLAARFAARGDYPIVEPCFLELAEPDIAGGGDRCVARGASRVLMVPYFLSAGVHLLRDLAAARDELRRRHPLVEFRLGPALGPHPLLDDLIAERIRQTEADEVAAGFPTPAEMAERYATMAGHEPAPAGRFGL